MSFIGDSAHDFFTLPKTDPVMVSGFSILPQGKDNNNWCWCAVTASIDRFYEGSSLKNCDVANDVLSLSNCCQTPTPKNCDQTARLEKGLEAFEHDCGIYEPVDFAYVQAEIRRQRPLPIRIGWKPNAAEDGHFVVIDGFKYDGSVPHLHVSNPSRADDPDGWCPYSKVVEGYDLVGLWTATFYTRPTSQTLSDCLAEG